MNNSSNQGSDNSAVAFWVIGGASAFAILLCCISACRRMKRRADAPNGSQTSQVAPAAVNGGTKDGDLVIDVSEPAVAVIDLAAQEGGGACCCGGGGCGDGDGGGCGGCGGGD